MAHCSTVASNPMGCETRTERAPQVGALRVFVLSCGAAGVMRQADRDVGRAAETVVAADSPRGSLGSSPISQVPLDGCLQASGKFSVGVPTAGNCFDSFANRDFAIVAEVERFTAVV